MTAPTTINPANTGTVKFGPVGTGTMDSYECQVTAITATPSPNFTTRPGTFCAGPAQVPGASSWALEVGFLQDWGATKSLSEWAFEHDGELMAFEYVPAAAGVKGLRGEVYVVAGNYGGPAAEVWVAEVSWPLAAKPELVAAPAPTTAAAKV
jgi:hypothetical protein